MLPRILIVVVCCTLLSCKNFVERYKRSNSGLSSLDKKVLYDFRQPIPTGIPPIDPATQRIVVAAIPPSSCPVAEGWKPPGPPKIVSISRGAFTYAAEDEVAYLVSPTSCPSSSLLVFTGAKLQASSLTSYSSIAGTFDLNRDDKNELLLLGETSHNGEISREASLQTFEKNTLHPVEDFGIVYHDSCTLFAGADEAKKQKLINSGLTPFVESVVVYYLPHPSREMPSFTAERYRAPCPSSANVTPTGWQLVTR